ncbi:hypothetical protein Poli38472_000601 [Pythium oligandrum]|uniref:Uncharacterized protein n=1 Tax=Pythium oligandrum TaxID=41045 RepID=A0A8K1CCK9_PYTOL|nr:hypothetical protein Poli38472_000601 [Pythium oligandrum]|eukprot:TMW60559.1 hypothetical protein Poli38472_000601 [Pythium oligandrum]
MEDMAAMLGAVAGGLQASFGTVVNRVEQSLEQSAQMMQMMNSMMEAALLQSIVISTTWKSAQVHVHVENRSQIQIREALMQVYVADTEPSVVVVNQALTEWETQSPRELVVPLASFGQQHTSFVVRLSFQSPGTQQTLRKETPLRIPVLRRGRVEAVASPWSLEGSAVRAESSQVAINSLRELLDISPFDPVLTDDRGFYRFEAPTDSSGQERSYLINIRRSSNSDQTVVSVSSAVAATDDAATVEAVCTELVQEMEAWVA